MLCIMSRQSKWLINQIQCTMIFTLIQGGLKNIMIIEIKQKERKNKQNNNMGLMVIKLMCQMLFTLCGTCPKKKKPLDLYIKFYSKLMYFLGGLVFSRLQENISLQQHFFLYLNAHLPCSPGNCTAAFKGRYCLQCTHSRAPDKKSIKDPLIN